MRNYISLLSVFILLFSCRDENHSTINSSYESLVIDSIIGDSKSKIGSLTTEEYTLKMKMDIPIVEKKKAVEVKVKYPKVKFSTNIGEKHNDYLAYVWAITFYVGNGQLETFAKFRKAGFPMEWWGSGMCSFYPVSDDSVSYFLKKARAMGYKDYGFDCEKLDVIDFDGVLSNTIEINFKPGCNREALARKYGLELREENSGNWQSYRSINKGAKDHIKTVENLNNEKGVKKAVFKFTTCDNHEGYP